jgi:phosphohistidine phosphatase SixA
MVFINKPEKIARQCHEDDVAKVVLVHEPGLEALLGSLHPSGSLYEKPMNIELAKKNHQSFKKSLKKNGVEVLDIKEVLKMDSQNDLKHRVELEEVSFLFFHLFAILCYATNNFYHLSFQK